MSLIYNNVYFCLYSTVFISKSVAVMIFKYENVCVEGVTFYLYYFENILVVIVTKKIFVMKTFV